MKDVLFILGGQCSGKTTLAQKLRTGLSKVVESSQPFSKLSHLKIYDAKRHRELIIVSSAIQLEDIKPAPHIRVIELTQLSQQKIFNKGICKKNNL